MVVSRSLAAFSAAGFVLQRASAEWGEISNVPQDFTQIRIEPGCETQFSGVLYTVPTWTIEPVEDDDEVKIFTNPANLLDAFVVDKALKFEYLSNAFQPPPQAGVRILVPRSRLEYVSTKGQGNYQVLVSPEGIGGFTNLGSMQVEHDKSSTGTATMHVSLPVSAVEQFSYRNSGGGSINNRVLSGANMTQLNLISSAGVADYNLELNASSFRGYFQGQGQMKFDGSPTCPDGLSYDSSQNLMRSPASSCLCVNFVHDGVDCQVTTDSLVPEVLELTSTGSGTKVCTINRGSGAPGRGFAAVTSLGFAFLVAWLLF